MSQANKLNRKNVVSQEEEEDRVILVLNSIENSKEKSQLCRELLLNLYACLARNHQEHLMVIIDSRGIMKHVGQPEVYKLQIIFSKC